MPKVKMDFEQFKDFCAGQQRQYITEERERMAKAREAKTASEFARLALHPMTPTMIDARLVELDKMEAQIPTQFGDTEVMRWSFARYQGVTP